MSAGTNNTHSFTIEGAGQVHILNAYHCFAALEDIASVTISDLETAIRDRWPGVSPGVDGFPDQFPLASVVVSLDASSQFDVDLSIREPIEIQVWGRGRPTVEIEFVGDNVRAEDPASPPPIRDVLSEWGDAHGLPLADLFNDRGRSLAEVWNARFHVDAPSRTVGELIGLAQRAIRVTEASRSVRSYWDWCAALETQGAALLEGSYRSPVLRPLSEEATTLEGLQGKIALEVCAAANAAHGGLIVVGPTTMRVGDETVITELRATPGTTAESAASEIVRERIFPVPDGFSATWTADTSSEQSRGALIVRVPPQDRQLKPFIVHDTRHDEDIAIQSVALAERRGLETHTEPVAGLHAAIAVGRALLSRSDKPGKMSDSQA